MITKVRFIKVILSTILLFLGKQSISQSLPVGTPVLDDYYRRQQLLGKVDSNYSFLVRPLYPGKISAHEDIFNPENKSDNLENNGYKSSRLLFAQGKGMFQILPLTLQQQYNSDHPYGWNDGLMIPAKGYQTLLSGGFFIKYGPLSVQFRPEYVYAANLSFNGYASGHNDAELISYYQYHNLIDNPERYGNSAFSRASLGQSSIRLTFGALSFGLSNENLWWGPGIRNAIILSNNAPGFTHFTLNTVKPLKTFLGTFEGQIIAGDLKNTGLTQLLTSTTSNGQDLFNAPRNDTRYFTAVDLVYHPKWVPGLFLGLIRSFDAYRKDVDSFAEYFPFLIPYTKVSIGDGNQGDPIPRDQQTSLSARWLFTKAHAEMYFEYALNDNSFNLNDFFGSPQHSRAYTVGFRKFIPILSKPGDAILLSGEITQLSQSLDRLVRNASGWYIHSEVRQGMTNYGQVLGSGTGSGGNIQSADISWVRGLKKLGVMFERYEHDVDFYQAYLSSPINGHSRKWVDLGLALQGDWNYKNFLINAKIEGIRSLNYEWILKNYNPDTYYIPNNNVFNLHAELGLTYRF